MRRALVSESWVEARLTDDGDGSFDDAYPCDGAPRPELGWEQVSLLAPEMPDVACAWLASQRPEPAAATSSRKKPKKSSRPALPPDLVGCLMLQTDALKAQGWSQPPCSRRVLYWRQSAALEVGAPALTRRAMSAEPVEAVLFALSTPSGNLHALPTIASTLPQAELFLRILVGTAQQMGLGPLHAL